MKASLLLTKEIKCQPLGAMLHLDHVYQKSKTHNSKTVTSESFEYETKIIGRTSANNRTLDTEVSSWKSLNLTLTNCEIELDISWSKDCVKSKISRTSEVATNPDSN